MIISWMIVIKIKALTYDLFYLRQQTHKQNT